MPNTTTYILYHAGCPDGFASALAARLYFKDTEETVEYIPVGYSTAPLPIVNSGSKVYIVDFSYPLRVLETLSTICDVQVIDHHKTAMHDLASFSKAIFNMEESGATLTYQYFFPDQPVPLFFRYIKDRDLWQFKLPYSKEFHSFITSIDQTFEYWGRVKDYMDKFEDGITIEKDNLIIPQGGAILRYRQQVITSLINSAIWLNIGGYRVPVINCPVQYGSDACNQILEKLPKAKFAAYFSITPSGEKWGLRSRPDFDCSVIAKEYGGGGHAQASGFTVESSLKSPLNNLLVLT